MTFSEHDIPEMVDAYKRLLMALRGVTDQPPDTPMTSHWPVVGGSCTGDLLVVGQAVFGWIPEWQLGDLGSDEGIARVLDETRAPLNDRADPMSWIATNPSRRSPFWRAVHLIADGLAGGSTSTWHSRIAWANLYPVARNDPPGNPYGQIRDLQTSPAAAFLEATVAALQPRLVLVLAGPFWWPFAEILGMDSMVREEKPLLRSGEREGARWVVGWHPAGAQRRGWGAEHYAARVLKTAIPF